MSNLRKPSFEALLYTPPTNSYHFFLVKQSIVFAQAEIQWADAALVLERHGPTLHSSPLPTRIICPSPGPAVTCPRRSPAALFNPQNRLPKRVGWPPVIKWQRKKMRKMDEAWPGLSHYNASSKKRCPFFH